MVFVCIAHRGLSASAPENTVAAFDKAIALGFDNIETDCQLSADKFCFIVHDEQLGRVNNGSGAVAAASASYIATLDAGSWFDPVYKGQSVPRLEDILEQYKGKIHLHLELKSAQEDLPQVVAAHIKAYGWDAYAAAPPASPGSPEPAESLFAVPGLTITSFHLHQLVAMRQLLPGVRLGWLMHELDKGAVQQATQARLSQLCPRANILTAEGVQLAHSAGLSVRAWGIKNVELLHRAVACGAQGATVNWPDVAQQALQQVHGQQQAQQ